MNKKVEKPLSGLGSVPSAGTKEASGVSRPNLVCIGLDPSCYLLPQLLTKSRWRSAGLKCVGPHGEEGPLGEGEPLLQAVLACFLSL